MKEAAKTPRPLPPIQRTEPEVFIIESLSFEDEVAQRYEGKVLADLLRLAGKKPFYHYFRTERELQDLAHLFRLSKYRYLHLSCHGSPDAIYTTLEQIPTARFASIFEGHLILRRLFISACEIGSGFLAEHVRAKNKGMHSVASPIDQIRFDRAVAIWAAFYVRMFDFNPDSMTSKNIGELLTNLSRLFGVRFNWSWYKAKSDSWKQKELDGGQAEESFGQKTSLGHKVSKATISIATTETVLSPSAAETVK
jgi:hypothetical protein